MPSRIAAELAQLARLARDGGLDLSQVSLRVKADLLMSMPNPPADDIAAFREMAVALVPTIDEPTAVILARKLAGWRHTPQPILEALAARGGEVLVALLRHDMPLSVSDLEILAESCAAEAALAVAERGDLTPAAVFALASRDDRAIDLALIANAEVPMPAAALDLLIARARSGDAAYGAGLLARRDIASSDLVPLFPLAGPERRRAMIEAVGAIEALGSSERRPAPPSDVLDGWLALASSDRDGAFGAIAGHLGGDAELARAMAEDRSRDLAAMALVAAGVRVEDATRFLIRLGDDAAHSVERIFALVALMRDLRPAVAHSIVMQVAGLSASPAMRRSTHQPAMAPGGTSSRPGAARPEAPALLGDVMRKLGLRRSAP
ncbi:hypothetical protein [Bosea sp. PAMC 26642]|uniref:hypothetical protein n=1 Tax=Bosea sp. (strain PAMC 26642) TaxID=1792307 RepID=UPI00077013D5|nr:hypothetical protein [Bosea sp. PAMC 26642]AMJ59055.1 hypothetical protein AXW83_00965 [Bosea sp. PAMC 26642]